ncbi:uncharacterized protein H6S33_007204, partial [Morchella sextelata]|uniref:uncharacterized protein n=1 Tax=Morchella sextelata TaxID=1174677 RepID=UPI001D052CE6
RRLPGSIPEWFQAPDSTRHRPLSTRHRPLGTRDSSQKSGNQCNLKPSPTANVPQQAQQQAQQAQQHTPQSDQQQGQQQAQQQAQNPKEDEHVRDAYQTTRVHYAELRVRLTATKVEVSKVSLVNVEALQRVSSTSPELGSSPPQPSAPVRRTVLPVGAPAPEAVASASQSSQSRRRRRLPIPSSPPPAEQRQSRRDRAPETPSRAQVTVRDAYQTTRVHYAELRVRLTATKIEVSKVSSVNVEYNSP